MDRFIPIFPLATDANPGVCLKMQEQNENLAPGFEYQCSGDNNKCEYAIVIGGVTTARKQVDCPPRTRAMQEQ